MFIEIKMFYRVLRIKLSVFSRDLMMYLDRDESRVSCLVPSHNCNHYRCSQRTGCRHRLCVIRQYLLHVSITDTLYKFTIRTQYDLCHLRCTLNFFFFSFFLIPGGGFKILFVPPRNSTLKTFVIPVVSLSVPLSSSIFLSSEGEDENLSDCRLLRV